MAILGEYSCKNCNGTEFYIHHQRDIGVRGVQTNLLAKCKICSETHDLDEINESGLVYKRSE